MVERNLLTNFRDTVKELKVKERWLINFLLKGGYVYRDRNKKLRPVAQYVPELFELKEYVTETYANIQTLITLRGRDKFRLLIERNN